MTGSVERPMPVADHEVTRRAGRRRRRPARRRSRASRPAPPSRSRRAPCRRTAGRTSRAAAPAPRPDRGRTARTPGRPRAPAPAGRARRRTARGWRRRRRRSSSSPSSVSTSRAAASSTRSRWSSGSWTDPPVEQLHHQVGRLVQRGHRRRSAGPGPAWAGARRRGCGRGSSRPRRPRTRGGGDQLLERRRQLRAVGLGGLGSGRRDGDQERRGHRASCQRAAAAPAGVTGLGADFHRNPAGSACCVVTLDVMWWLVVIPLVWIGVSVPLGILVGRAFAAGWGSPRRRAQAASCPRHSQRLGTGRTPEDEAGFWLGESDPCARRSVSDMVQRLAVVAILATTTGLMLLAVAGQQPVDRAAESSR